MVMTLLGISYISISIIYLGSLSSADLRLDIAICSRCAVYSHCLVYKICLIMAAVYNSTMIVVLEKGFCVMAAVVVL